MNMAVVSTMRVAKKLLQYSLHQITSLSLCERKNEPCH